MNRALLALEAIGARLAFLDGGNKHNAIPRECEAVLLVPSKRLEDAGKIVDDLSATVQASSPPWNPTFCQHGQDEFEKKMEGDAQRRAAENNEDDFCASSRRDQDERRYSRARRNLHQRRGRQDGQGHDKDRHKPAEFGCIGNQRYFAERLVYFRTGRRHGPAHRCLSRMEAELGFPILGIAKSAFRALYGKDPEVKAIHAGLECGIIGERVPGMDMVSFGPTLEGVHSPDEKIYIDTVERFWNFLLEILKRIN